MLSTEMTLKSCSQFYCEICDYVTCKKSSYDKHILTAKHVFFEENGNFSTKEYICEGCSKVYKERTGLWKHVKKCTPQSVTTLTTTSPSNTNSNMVDINVVFEFMKQTQEFKNLIIGQQQESFKLYQDTIKKQEETYKYHEESQKQMIDMMKDTMGSYNNNVNCNNTTNNKFNLNFFLNETCKDAMNIDEFIDSIEVSFEDVEYSGKHGFAEGISRIFVRELNKLEVCKRPIHCSDLKREVFHIKTKDSRWENEQTLIFKMINLITRKNMIILKDWGEANPLTKNMQSAIHDRFVLLQIACIGPYDDKVEKKEFSKIISKIAKATVIDKKRKHW
jgi:hypothetical protein